MVIIVKHIICLSLTCDGTAYTGCLTCDGANHRSFDSITKQCPCDILYFDDGYSLC